MHACVLLHFRNDLMIQLKLFLLQNSLIHNLASHYQSRNNLCCISFFLKLNLFYKEIIRDRKKRKNVIIEYNS